MANKETTMSTTQIDDVKLGCDLIGDINSYIREHGLKHNDTTLWNDIIKSAPVEAHQQMAQIAYELYSSGYKSPKMSDSQQFTRVGCLALIIGCCFQVMVFRGSNVSFLIHLWLLANAALLASQQSLVLALGAQRMPVWCLENAQPVCGLLAIVTPIQKLLSLRMK